MTFHKNRSANIFIERSLKNVLDFFKEAVFSEEIARSKGFLQSIDMRIKMPLLIAFLAFSVFANTASFLILFYAVSIVLALLSGIKLAYFLKRVWFFIPLFTLLIAVPAVFIQGPYTAFLFILRVTTCVSFVIVFTITTPHNRLLKSLRSIGVPYIFVQVLDMMYRYVFLFMKIFEEMHMSLKSRLVQRLHTKEAHRWIASRIVSLFRRSLKMSEEVYIAMLARGYDIERRK